MSSNKTINQQSEAGRGVSIRISTPGKIILFGEHSVVYNKLAIAASLGLRTKLFFIENSNCCNNNQIVLEFTSINSTFTYNFEEIKRNFLNRPIALINKSCSRNFNFSTPELLDHQALVDKVQHFLEQQQQQQLNDSQRLALSSFFYLFTGILSGVQQIHLLVFHLKIETDLTVCAGTGSSASYLVSIAAALLQLIKLKASRNEIEDQSICHLVKMKSLTKFDEDELNLISEWAFCAEKIIHGMPSGVDNTVCTFGNLVEFRKSTKLKLVKLNNKLKILLVNTKIARDTKVLVQKVANLHHNHENVVNNILQTMDVLAGNALDYLKRIDATANSKDQEIIEYYTRLAELTDINQHLLSSLGVSHIKLNEICAVLLENGLHGKLTGAGGGGYAICLIPPFISELVINKTIAQLIERNYSAVLADLGGVGVRIE